MWERLHSTNAHKEVTVNTARSRIAASLAGATALVLVATGCSTGGGEAGGGGDEQITLSITTFGTMGVDAKYDEYMKQNPNIKIEATNLEGGGAARDDAYAKIAANTGLSDIVAIEEGWLGTIPEDAFEDLRDYGIEDVKDSWLDWKYEQGTTTDGKVIGAGLDVGPQGLCYRGDLFAEAGLPSERDEVAEYFGGDDATWDRFFEVGQEYVDATGKAFYHSPRFFWNSFVNQQKEGYYKKDGETLNVKGNDVLKEQFDKIVEAENDGLGANLPGWEVGPEAKAGDFAVYMCRSWMLGIVQGYYDEGTTDSGWDFANVLPGGAANWGGAFLGVASSSEHPEEAAELALWLASPEQQASAFEVAGPFPSTPEGQELVADTTSAFFNDAPVGKIFAERSKGVVAQVKGPEDSNIQDNVFGPIFDRVSQGEVTDPDEAWDQAMELLDQIVG